MGPNWKVWHILWWGPFLSDFCPFSSFWLPHHSTMMLCLTSGPQEWNRCTMNWNLWNHEPKSKFSPLNFFLRYVATVMKYQHITFFSLALPKTGFQTGTQQVTDKEERQSNWRERITPIYFQNSSTFFLSPDSYGLENKILIVTKWSSTEGTEGDHSSNACSIPPSSQRWWYIFLCMLETHF